MTVEPSADLRAPAADLLPRAGRLLWTRLPVILAINVAVCASALPGVLVSPQLGPVRLLVSALTVGPVWAAALATSNALVLQRSARAYDPLRGVLRHGRTGAAVALLPAVTASLALVTHLLWQRTGASWLLVPLGLDLTAFVLAGLGAVVAVPLAVEFPVLRGRRLWAVALTLVAARPWIPLGVVALAGLGLLAGLSLSASLLLLVPGPVALLTSAGVWSAVGALRGALPLPTAQTSMEEPSRVRF
jgi:hypothetical protein